MRHAAVPAPYTRQPTLLASSTETALLLCCARSSLTEEDSRRARQLLSEEIAWGELLDTARRHAVIPLLHKHIRALGEHMVPAPARRELGAAFIDNAGCALRAAGELVQLVNLFTQNGIRALSYKGPALAVQLYGDIALRQVRDLDILLRPQDLPRARELLQARGYRSLDPLAAAPGTPLFRSQYQHRWERRTDGLLVELHWRIAPPTVCAPLGVEELWPGRDEVTIGRDWIPVLGKSDLLLVLCIHGSKHRWKHLEWICGVAELVRMGGVDWERALAQAVYRGSLRMLFLGLWIAHELLAAPVPGEVLRPAARDPHVRALADQTYAHLFPDGEAELASRGARWKLNRFQLASQETLRGKARYIHYWVRARVIHRLGLLSPGLLDRLR